MCPRCQNFGCAFLPGLRFRVVWRKTFSANSSSRSIPFYGASECGGICYDQDGTTFENVSSAARCNGSRLNLSKPTAASSQIRVRSAAVSDGYFPEGRTETWAMVFLCRMTCSLSMTRRCTIVGRVSDVINVAGKKVNPAEIEAQLLRFDGVRQAVVFGRSTGVGLRNEEVTACVQALPQTTENESDLAILPSLLKPLASPEADFYRL